MQGILLMLLPACVAALLLYSRREAFDGGAEAAIIGGTPVDPTRYPWFCKLETPGTGICAGVLIASNFVLTASHCKASTNTTVTLYDGTRIGVISETKAPSSDMQLLMLERHVDTQKIPPIKLATALPPRNAAPVTVIGRGQTFAGDMQPVDDLGDLHKITINYATPEFFRWIQKNELSLRGVTYPQTKVMLYSMNNKLTCFGDSGGPVFIERAEGPPELLGIISRNSSNCGAKTKKYYFTGTTSVPYMRFWILKSSSDLQDAAKLKPCSFTGRVTKDRKTYRCHPNWPWDAGTWDQPKMPLFLAGKQCAQNERCAKWLRDIAGTRGFKMGAARYTP